MKQINFQYAFASVSRRSRRLDCFTFPSGFRLLGGGSCGNARRWQDDIIAKPPHLYRGYGNVSAWAFASAILIIVIWGLTGPTFHYSDTWQLIINTGTTIVTFLMVFLIQNTQNRDAKAAHLKLDEIIRALQGARNELIDLEKLADEDLTALEKQFERVRKKAEQSQNNVGGMNQPTRSAQNPAAVHS
jgi:low affinity Fe/Cu permease